MENINKGKDITKKRKEVLAMYDEDNPKPIEVIVVTGALIGAVCLMKHITESCHNKKLTWKEFLFPKQEKK